MAKFWEASTGEVDRNAILLRYFENRSLREVGEVLGFTDHAIQKRLSRAVEKLRVYFQRRGKAMGVESLSAAMAHFAVSPLPASTVAGVSAAILQSSSFLTPTITTTTMKSFVLSSYLKPALLGVAGLTAAVAWLGEHRKVTTERSRAQELEARIVELELAAAAVSAPASSAASVRLAEAERLELARLRGEVKRLRHQLERSGSAVAMSPRPNPPAAIDGEIQPTSTVLDRKRHQEQIEVLKHVGLGLRILCTSVESDTKSRSLQFGEDGSLPKPFLDLVAPVEASLDQIEILVPDVPSMLKAEAMPQAIVARARQALLTPDGQFIRAYSLGDGSVQSIRHATADEAFGWGQDIGGKPIQWEAGQATERFDPAKVSMDPELARRYGLRVDGR